jgi:hypothetical protein
LFSLIIAYQDDKLMTKSNSQVHVPVISIGYTIATDALRTQYRPEKRRFIMAQIQADGIEYPLATLWQETGEAHFLHTLTMHETLAALEKRRDLTEQWLAQLNREAMCSQRANTASLLMLDHYHTMLNAELAWLSRTIQILHTRVYTL